MPKLNIERFEELRKEKGWTLAHIARRVKVSSTTPASWARGLTNPTRRKMEIVAEIFEVEVEELIRRTD